MAVLTPGTPVGGRLDAEAIVYAAVAKGTIVSLSKMEPSGRGCKPQ
jgi:hypothetical protein